MMWGTVRQYTLNVGVMTVHVPVAFDPCVSTPRWTLSKHTTAAVGY